MMIAKKEDSKEMARMARYFSAAVLLLVALSCSSAHASTIIAYNVPLFNLNNIGNPPSVGNQGFGGSLGMDFVVNAPIVVTALGVFDSGQNGLQSTLTAAIYSRSGNTGTLLFSTVFTAGQTYTLVGASRFQTVSQVLQPGSYSMVSWGYSASEPLGNKDNNTIQLGTTNDGGGLISFVGGGRYGSAGSFPTTNENREPNPYWAGTFEYQAFVAPEPTTLVLLGGSLLTLGLLRRRSSQSPRA